MEKERKHYAGRWICQKPIEKCDGYFNVESSGKVQCPLASKCLTSPYPRGQLETIYLPAHFGRMSIQSEPDWNIKHATRRNEAKAAFTPEAVREYFREYRKENRKYLNKLHREKYEPSLSYRFSGYLPLNALKSNPPPCGGDHENCPYDDGCHYPDWEEQQDKKREAKRRGCRKYAEKRKERMKTDPIYAERERARGRAYQKAYRQRKHDIMGVKRKEERPPTPRCGRPWQQKGSETE